MSAVCPVYPQQQTSPDTVGTSHLCHQRKSSGSQSLACDGRGAHRRCLGARGGGGGPPAFPPVEPPLRRGGPRLPLVPPPTAQPIPRRGPLTPAPLLAS